MDKFSQIDEKTFRGSRPLGPDDLFALQKRGIKTIISLEEGWGTFFGHWSKESQVWEGLGGYWLQVKLSSVVPPTAGQVYAIYSLIKVYQAHGNVFFHCYSGVDRTGVVAADYRVVEQGWTPERAWQEAIAEGMHWRYQRTWKPAFLRAFAK